MTRSKGPFRHRKCLTSKNRLRTSLALFLGFCCGFLFSSIVLQYFVVAPKTMIDCHRVITRVKPAPRPGDFATELPIRKGFILIGVMTANHLLPTRAKTIHQTWGNKIDSGKIIFFTGAERNTSVNFTVVNLPGVDDGYPPQRKSFHMLQYIHDQYLDDFDWFVRADDDVYIRSERLSALLRTMNSSEDVLLGQGGVGKPPEIGKIGLLKGDNFCIGGPGVILSRNVLRKVGPYLNRCLNETVSFHEDVELGRCIRKYVGVICPWAKEVEHLFHQIFGKAEIVFSRSLQKKGFARAITVHPVKKSSDMHRLHFEFLSSTVQRLQDRSARLHRRLQRTKGLLRGYADSNITKSFHKADFCGRLPRNTSLPWELFDMQFVNSLSEPPVVWLSGRPLQAVKKIRVGAIDDLNAHAQKLMKQPEEFKKLNLGAMRVHPVVGIQFSIDFETLLKPSVPDFPEMPRHAYHYGDFQRAFAPLLKEIVAVERNAPVVHFIVPLVKRFDAFVRFLSSFEEAFIEKNKQVSLQIVYFPDVAPAERHKTTFEDFQAKHPGVDLKWSDLDGEFSRARALELGTKNYGDDALLFFADVDLIFRTEFYDRCQFNTLPGQRVYFPTMFSMFNPQIAYYNQTTPPKETRLFSNRVGTWRKYSFGPVCVYASDVIAVGGLNTTIRGWGLEDMDFYEKCLRHQLEVFRAPDQGLVHVYHPQTSCHDPIMNTLQVKMCEDSRLRGLASAESLVEYMLSKGYL